MQLQADGVVERPVATTGLLAGGHEIEPPDRGGDRGTQAEGEHHRADARATLRRFGVRWVPDLGSPRRVVAGRAGIDGGAVAF